MHGLPERKLLNVNLQNRASRPCVDKTAIRMCTYSALYVELGNKVVQRTLLSSRLAWTVVIDSVYARLGGFFSLSCLTLKIKIKIDTRVWIRSLHWRG